jgi:cytochrome c-type biogenesis protein CcmH/NrfF
MDIDTILIAIPSLDKKNKEVKTLTDHLSVYVLVASKTSPWVTFLKIVLWILIIIGLIAGGWYLWVLYQRRQYQQQHRDDYIYRS